MNASYGKTIEGDHQETHRVMHKGTKFNQFVKNNFNTIKEITNFGQNYHFITDNREVSSQTTNPQVGVIILDTSKRIMNEVMCLAEDNNIPLYYQDTDSMHMLNDDIDRLG